MLTAPELVELEELHYKEPFAGEYRADLRAGIVAHAACQPHCKRQMRPVDFMPYQKRPRQNEESMKAQFQMFKAATERKRAS